ncbi:hypothetical protein EET67_18540 [Pseudaminobacter arsenicus]|uniref:Uncharacterized protein n=1 Tax=Borborobacter arsenicus TaxID=1851146 RepID=A0A432V2E2_9HYPH|nr:hypothetical protein EET67_18540 [Pseudaminobacter arsenicus]
MTSALLRNHLRSIRWSSATLAEALECDETTVIGWLLGFDAIPTQVAVWVEALAEMHERCSKLKPRLGEEPTLTPMDRAAEQLRQLGKGPRARS